MVVLVEFLLQYTGDNQLRVRMSDNDVSSKTMANNENSANVLKVNKARLKWACRRGMLELDVLFIPFVDEAYDDLSTKEQFTFERLLTCQDPELFAWFMGHEICEDTELSTMVQLILKRVKI
ncbi:protein of unknown function DUF339 [Colwellia psychrerythraea]|uniref:FAD assembly factor SdhE n=2 Tax=Colwellia psychrerythraea TaxID=28229 RepID=A0A099KFF6_COLPS|nr:protein of unknown function DUF339 [Colwellia psychrerythraea]